MTQESGMVTGIVAKGPNRWSLILDGLVRGVSSEFLITAFGNPEQEIFIQLKVKLVENCMGSEVDNDDWSISGWVDFGEFDNRKKLREKLCKQIGITFKSENEEPFLYFFSNYSSATRKGAISFTFDLEIAQRRQHL